jgi:hypothetical protein
MSHLLPVDTSASAAESRSARERGQAVLLVLGALALAGALCFAIARLGVAAGERAQAETAADAAALAGAADGQAAARRVAQMNGGALLTFAREGDDVIVTVRVRRVTAAARARRRAGPRMAETDGRWHPV